MELSQDFVNRIVDGLDLKRLIVGTRADHPDGSAQGPGLLDSLVLQQLLELAMSCRGEVLGEDQSLVVEKGGRHGIPLVLQNGHPDGRGSKLDDDGRRGLDGSAVSTYIQQQRSSRIVWPLYE